MAKTIELNEFFTHSGNTLTPGIYTVVEDPGNDPYKITEDVYKDLTKAVKRREERLKQKEQEKISSPGRNILANGEPQTNSTSEVSTAGGMTTEQVQKMIADALDENNEQWQKKLNDTIDNLTTEEDIPEGTPEQPVVNTEEKKDTKTK